MSLSAAVMSGATSAFSRSTGDMPAWPDAALSSFSINEPISPDTGPSYRNYSNPESGRTDRLSRQACILVYTASMRVVLKSNNPVILSYATHILEESGIEALVFDTHACIMDGSTIMVPRRLLVADEDFNRAEKLLRAAVPEAMP